MKINNSDKAPKAIGPYSHSIISGNLLFLSGQLPINPTTNEIPSSIEEQTQQSLHNALSILESANLSKNHVVKTTLYLKNMSDFTVVNKIYETFFENHKPARTTIEIARLPKDALIEIEMIAEIN